MNPIQVALWCAIPLAIGVSVDSLELIGDRLQLADGGLYGYPVLATARELTLTGPLAAMFRVVFSYPAVLSLPAVQLAAAALLLVAAVLRAPVLVVPAGIAVVVILAARLLLVLRSPISRDAGDSMTFVVCTGVAVCLLVSNRISAEPGALLHRLATAAVVYRCWHCEGRIADLAIRGGDSRCPEHHRARIAHRWRVPEAPLKSFARALLERRNVRVLRGRATSPGYTRCHRDHCGRTLLPHLYRRTHGNQQLRMEFWRYLPRTVAARSYGWNTLALAACRARRLSPRAGGGQNAQSETQNRDEGTRIAPLANNFCAWT